MSTSYQLELADSEATREAGKSLGEALEAGNSIGLVGDLGAGKTTFVQGVGEGVGLPGGARVTSPTFALMHEYLGGRVSLVHADLYRIEEQRELDEIGLYEACGGPAAVFIEWCERFPVLPHDHLRIELTLREGGGRRLHATAHGPGSTALLTRWRQR